MTVLSYIRALDVLFLLGSTGTVTGLIALLSPLPIFIRIVLVPGSADKNSFWPYVCALFSCAVWALYGHPNVGDSRSVMVINVAGCIIQGSYCTVLLLYMKDSNGKRKLASVISSLSLVFFCTAALIFTFIPMSARGALVGLLGDLMSVMATASPMAAVRTMALTKDVQFFPISLCIMNFVNTSVWMLFGIASLDAYITLPNVAGVILSASQIYLYCLYRKTDDAKVFVENTMIDPSPLLEKYQLSV